MLNEEFKRISLLINNENLKELDRISKKKGMNRTSVINFLISEFIREENRLEKEENIK